MTEAQEKYIAAAVKAGVPRDQFENFARAGVVLQPKQLQFAAACRLCDSPDGPVEIGFGGCRGGAKSFSLLNQIGNDDCQRVPGLKALMLRSVGKAGKESFEDLRRMVLMGLPHEYKQQAGILTYPNGSRIVLGHFKNERDIDNYLGLEYDVIGVEEATTLSARKYRDIGTCNRSSKPGWRPRMYTTTNPGGLGHQWYLDRFIKPYRKGEETTTKFIQSTVRDNRFINPDYIKKLEELTGWQRRAWLDGDWDIAAGQFFTTFRRDVHVIKPFDIPDNWQVWGSLDYGFTHYTVFHLFAKGDGKYYTVDAHAERGWLPVRHAQAIKALLARRGLSAGRLASIEAGADVFNVRDGGPTIAEQYEAQGLTLARANTERINGAARMLELLGDPDANIAPKWFIMDRCARLADCIPSMQHDPNRPEDVLKVDTDEDGNGGDDEYDCARYSLNWNYQPIRQSKVVGLY